MASIGCRDSMMRRAGKRSAPAEKGWLALLQLVQTLSQIRVVDEAVE